LTPISAHDKPANQLVEQGEIMSNVMDVPPAEPLEISLRTLWMTF